MMSAAIMVRSWLERSVKVAVESVLPAMKALLKGQAG